MGNAGRNGGEYYTPRPLIRAIVHVVKPKVGERIYDGAVGSAGFLCESFEYMKSKVNLTTKDVTTLQTRTFYGKEKKSLAYVIAIMNMILHGIEAPNIIHTNTLTEKLVDVQERDRYDIVLANPHNRLRYSNLFGNSKRRLQADYSKYQTDSLVEG
jgi:type I restriction enzyme M protein